MMWQIAKTVFFVTFYGLINLDGLSFLGNQRIECNDGPEAAESGKYSWTLRSPLYDPQMFTLSSTLRCSIFKL